MLSLLERVVFIPRRLLRRKGIEMGAAGEVPLHQGEHDDWSGHLDFCILLSSDDTPICIAIDAMRELYAELQAISSPVTAPVNRLARQLLKRWEFGIYISTLNEACIQRGRISSSTHWLCLLQHYPFFV